MENPEDCTHRLVRSRPPSATLLRGLPVDAGDYVLHQLHDEKHDIPPEELRKSFRRLQRPFQPDKRMVSRRSTSVAALWTGSAAIAKSLGVLESEREARARRRASSAAARPGGSTSLVGRPRSLSQAGTTAGTSAAVRAIERVGNSSLDRPTGLTEAKLYTPDTSACAYVGRGQKCQTFLDKALHLPLFFKCGDIMRKANVQLEDGGFVTHKRLTLCFLQLFYDQWDREAYAPAFYIQISTGETIKLRSDSNLYLPAKSLLGVRGSLRTQVGETPAYLEKLASTTTLPVKLRTTSNIRVRLEHQLNKLRADPIARRQLAHRVESYCQPKPIEYDVDFLRFNARHAKTKTKEFVLGETSKKLDEHKRVCEENYNRAMQLRLAKEEKYLHLSDKYGEHLSTKRTHEWMVWVCVAVSTIRIEQALEHHRIEQRSKIVKSMSRKAFRTRVQRAMAVHQDFKRLAAAHIILRAFRRFRFMKPLIMTRRAVHTIYTFLRWCNQLDMGVYINLFRKRVKVLQRASRAFLQCTEARVTLLLLQWETLESGATVEKTKETKKKGKKGKKSAKANVSAMAKLSETETIEIRVKLIQDLLHEWRHQHVEQIDEYYEQKIIDKRSHEEHITLLKLKAEAANTPFDEAAYPPPITPLPYMRSLMNQEEFEVLRQKAKRLMG
eukprot:Rmarinus@m.10925